MTRRVIEKHSEIGSAANLGAKNTVAADVRSQGGLDKLDHRSDHKNMKDLGHGIPWPRSRPGQAAEQLAEGVEVLPFE
ncbi:hypothetical protein GCM10010197_27640 [Nocardioides luteus]|uniref:Uncharacterized protein n=1 Tax=Nocardioides luteus TaxID=1844 RepID=A0ABQ5ST07_9ACTN|nr:hypothetical protein GCM10010197_27640 [Nocardioides luteus]GLJ67130.1 hypothetical protein GCM10017579_11660 [Nocardioides luteus]